MDFLWDKDAWDDYQYWIDTYSKVLYKIYILKKECQQTPFEGTGKPESLRHNFSGYWSRRITGEHRLVYKVEDDILYIAQCKYHS